ncbi:MAG: hypothetical protein JST93_15320 [Acidobacteria bacterium]|nr:hypothetical protein [Acidobacteriota bacterium]
MNGLADAFEKLLAAFDRLEMRYAVGGSVASSEYGTHRFTNDVDILVELDEDRVGDFVDCLSAEFYVDADMIQDAIRRGRSVNVIHIPTASKFDLFPAGNGLFPQRELDRRQFREIEVEGKLIDFAMVSPEDTILAKLDWMRQAGGVSEQQRRDILAVITIQGEKLDRAYLHEMAVELGVLEELNKFLQ